MKYEMRFTEQEIEENHQMYMLRQNIYKSRGLDFAKHREFILGKAGILEGPILEIGAGKGKTALSLAREGYDITSIDSDEEMLKITAMTLSYEKLLPKADLQLMDAYSIKFDSGSFNNVFMIEALHHMKDVGAIFTEIDRVLSPGGKFILSDFNEKGMEIVDHIHELEGHIHENSFAGKDEATRWLSCQNYMIENHEDECHWVIIAAKTASKK